MIFVSKCTGIKFDKSVEIDYVLGYWTSIEDILGQTFALGVGLDIAALGKKSDSDENGAQIEILFNSDRQLIGGAISKSSGYGLDLPIDWEVNFDNCITYQLWRLDFRMILAKFFKYLGEQLSPIYV